MSKKLTPYRDLVLAINAKPETKTATGLYIPPESQEKALEATVINVGPKCENVKIGDKIAYKRYATTELDFGEGEKYIVLEEKDCLVAVEETDV